MPVTMFRLRRYRVFVAFAVIVIFALYKFSNSDASWREQAASRFGQGHGGHADAPVKWEPKPQVAKETKESKATVPAANDVAVKQTPPPIAPVKPPGHESFTTTGKKSIPVGFGHPARPDPAATPLIEEDDAVGAASTSTGEAIHWKKTKEHFPIPTESLIALPTAKSKAIPKIQGKFKKESAAEKADRETKLATIKDVFKHSWAGYKEIAWLHDEVRPVTGKSKDPFAGWGATLVDALDTLWIMGLKEEFEDAVKAVGKIDFTTTSRADIPLFETTIRYLGGLLSAYDIAGKKHAVLLSKAKELAEILISAFDTPNRMPQTYYYWRPEFSANAGSASNHVVLAEIGSLSMEFTYLSQLTGEDKYYDAIARITDNLEGYQNNTRLPGMWPTYFDASGCTKHDFSKSTQASPQKPLAADDDLGWEASIKNGAYLKADPNLPLVKPAQEGSTSTDGEELSPEGKKYIPLEIPEPLQLVPNGISPDWKPPAEEPLVWPGSAASDHRKRQIGNGLEADAAPTPDFSKPTCDNTGFGPASSYGSEEYTLGGMSDSTYEYLPKQFLLLGGQVEKYRTMYESSIEVIKKYLIFRPMLPNNDDILYSGKLNVPMQEPDKPFQSTLDPEYAHLTCFAGGMIAMGAKIFDRPEELEIGSKLTEGCVYAYNMTTTGIMPESFEGVPCKSWKDCTWNETRYNEILDPFADSRIKQYKEAMVNYEIQLKSASSWYEEQLKELATAPPTPAQTGVAPEAKTTDVSDSILNKRQMPDLKDVIAAQEQNVAVSGGSRDVDEIPSKVQVGIAEPLPSKTLPTFPSVYSPRTPLDHKEYVQTRLTEERLPLGVTRLQQKYYILRPEAIESVWYMYRITGDDHWREAGWRMFVAINEHTKTKYGNSAIDDVTATSPKLDDSMESFWLAETLKYFYLLYSEPNVISLDEWVFNTEAHPFRRPT